jgi:hypothetical protein
MRLGTYTTDLRPSQRPNYKIRLTSLCVYVYPFIVARHRLGKNPPIVARQLLGRNFTAVTNTHK